MKKVFAIVALSLLLGACAGLQGNAGLNRVEFDWNEDGKPKAVRIIDGKEASAIQFSFQMPDGTILNFAAEEVRAFRGQEIRAEVEKALFEALGEAANSSLVDVIVKALGGK